MKGQLDELEASIDEHGCNGVDKLLKLCSTNTNTNMHLFDANDKLKKYNNIIDIIDDYFVTRLEMYKNRKEYMIHTLERELLLLSNKAKYIKENLDGTIDLRKKRKDQVVQMLKDKKYDIMDDDEDYKYLTKMSMDSVTEEIVNKLFKERENKETELDVIKQTSVNQMWRSELDNLRNDYIAYTDERRRLMDGDVKKNTVILKKKLVIKG
jgi:DNA topoisomerase-2